MAPALVRRVVSKLAARAAAEAADSPTNVFARGPLVARTMLLARDATATPTATVDPHVGVTSPKSINNNGMFALFGLLGAAMCIGMIWFFFWAKNGGFYFKENDWDEYKSTVLRRKGPNGTILSNATPSTNLGGGSIYKDVHDDTSTEDATTVVTASSGSTDLTGITGGVSDIVGREKRRKKREQREREKEREKERRREEKQREKAEKKRNKANKNNNNNAKDRSSRKVNEEGVLVDEEAEAAAQDYLRNYRHEKPARVGGLNKPSDSSTWDGSTNPSASSAGGPTEGGSDVTSELMSNREATPTNTPTKKSGGGIRKVYSTADRNAAREQERIRAEARRLQERGYRASHSHSHSHSSNTNANTKRRDFSWQYGEDASTPLRQIEEGDSSRVDGDGDGDDQSHVPGAWTDSGATESDLGTKSYRHHIPGLSTSSAVTESQDFAYTEEKRKQRQQRQQQRNSTYRG
ncbi:hypothetical protein SPI_03137 [Niveomyces insectorum RCEF 264]|uniref:Endosomal spry domain-containing protein n=1 Tax=Niveomyces insectorum RCEF 264 TaxID=1081102 RepID=A0A162MNC8_9HYPO|nr:hypothetical protein SPI_03137 [Niveomyces insectorum RCEF 264]